MADITLNSAVRSNLRTLQSTTDLMTRTESRLSTGKKVNSAFDNPGNFFTAKALNNRASDLNNLLDSVSSSIKTIQAADNGISAISDLVTQLKSSARSAQQSTSAVTTKAGFESSAVAGATADNLLGSSYFQVAGSQKLNDNTGTAANITGATKLSGTAGSSSDNLATNIANGDTLTVGGKTIRFYTDAAARTADSANATDTQLLITDDVSSVLSAVQTALGSGSSATVTAGKITVKGPNDGSSFTFGGTAATKLGLPATAAVSTNDLSGKTLTVAVGSGATKTVTFGTGAGQVSTLEGLNKELNAAGAQATISSSGKLTVETTNEFSAQKLVIGGTAVDKTAGAAGAGQIFDLTATAGADTKTAITGGDGKSRRTDYMNDYNDVREQISKLAKDASFNGVNLLAGDDLSVIFNENGSSTLNVSGVDLMDKLGLADITFDDFADSSKIEAVIEKLNTALTSLDTLSSRFGSQLSVVQTRQDFTKDMIGTLEDGADALTNADTNAEAANLATLQTRQSLVVSSLSISTSQEQNVLQLLR